MLFFRVVFSKFGANKSVSKTSSPMTAQSISILPEQMLTIKCVVVGDREAGKTCLLSSYITNKFPSEYIPTVFDTCTVTVRVNGKEYALKLYDTSGQEDYHRLRPLNYNETSVFLVCFSIVSPSTVKNVIEKWVPEISHYCVGTPFLLVGTQVDLRDDRKTLEKLAKNNQHVVTFEHGEELARELKAVKYVECSAQTQKGVKNVFEEAVLASMDNKSSYLCVLL